MAARVLLALGAICLLLTQTSCASAPSTGIDPSYCQSVVESVGSAPIPRHPDMEFLRGLADGSIEGFDVNEYFLALPHLSMEAGYTLDYDYFLEEDFGGMPLLHARPSQYATYSEYVEAEHSGESSKGSFLDHVQTDGSREGFFEFVVLRIMGSQFYLYWHAATSDAAIICNESSLEALLDGTRGLPSDVRRKARALNVEPVVEIGDDTVLVKIVIFSQWGGFIQRSFTIGRDFPHVVLQEERETLVEYNSGIVF